MAKKEEIQEVPDKNQKLVKHIINNKDKRGSVYTSKVFKSSTIKGAMRPYEDQKKILNKDHDQLGIENEDILEYYTKKTGEYTLEKSNSSFNFKDLKGYIYGPFTSRFWMLRIHTLFMSK